MKKANFLAKLFKQKTLQLVEPSLEMKDSYLMKSESSLISSKILLQNNRLEESVGLAYYSMYHSITALLFRVGIKCENHAAAIILLRRLFNIDNSEIKLAKTERIDKQYYVSFSITLNEVEDMIKLAEKFNKMILDFISRINSNEVLNYRIKFKSQTK
ncbi:MAG: HEPN domain-containing protein [Nanoarchaeota archaeon]